MTSTTERLAQLVFEDAARTCNVLAAALTTLHESLGGWPTSAPGAAPETGGGSIDLDELINGAVTLTTVERLAGQRDAARADLRIIHRALARASNDMKTAAELTRKWAGDTAGAKAPAAYDSGIWCENHLRHGQKEPRGANALNCDFCVAFIRDYKRGAPLRILQYRDARGGRIPEAEVRRILKEIDLEVRNAKRPPTPRRPPAERHTVQRDAADRRAKRIETPSKEHQQ